MEDRVNAQSRDGVRAFDDTARLPRVAKGPRSAALGRVVGRALRAQRLAAGLTQHALALRCGIPRPIICRLERGTHAPNIESIARYVHACGGSVADVGAAIDAARAVVPGCEVSR
jgi:DNA-binding XRE family transcriptional regulator